MRRFRKLLKQVQSIPQTGYRLDQNNVKALVTPIQVVLEARFYPRRNNRRRTNPSALSHTNREKDAKTRRKCRPASIKVRPKTSDGFPAFKTSALRTLAHMRSSTAFAARLLVSRCSHTKFILVYQGKIPALALPPPSLLNLYGPTDILGATR